MTKKITLELTEERADSISRDIHRLIEFYHDNTDQVFFNSFPELSDLYCCELVVE